MIPFIKKTERKRKPMLFQILLSPYYSHSLFLLLKACPLLSLILYSLILSLSLSTQRKQPSCNNLPSERNSMLHKTHKQRKERPTSPLSDRNWGSPHHTSLATTHKHNNIHSKKIYRKRNLVAVLLLTTSTIAASYQIGGKE